MCFRPPYPLKSGAEIRMFNNIKMLSEKYSLDLIFINNQKTDQNQICYLKQFCENVINFDFKKTEFIKNTIRGLIFNKKPLQVNYYYFFEIQKWVDNNFRNYDLIFCNHIRTAEYFKNKTVIKIIDYVDAMSMNYEKAYQNSKGFWKFIYWLEKGRISKYELEVSEKFDKKIIISNVDKEFLLKNGAKQVFFTLGNAVNITVPKKKILIDENMIMFLGKMDYEPNISAVKYFCKEIFPELKSRFSKLKFYIVGGYPNKEVKDLEKIDGVTVTGFVESKEEYILKSKLFIAPMISGSGLQNKVLEAMALGKCVVTSQIGAAGLKNLTKKELIIVKNSQEMIEKMLHLLSLDLKDFNNYGEEAKEYIKRNYYYATLKKDLLEFLKEKK